MLLKWGADLSQWTSRNCSKINFNCPPLVACLQIVLHTWGNKHKPHLGCETREPKHVPHFRAHGTWGECEVKQCMWRASPWQAVCTSVTNMWLQMTHSFITRSEYRMLWNTDKNNAHVSRHLLLRGGAPSQENKNRSLSGTEQKYRAA